MRELCARWSLVTRSRAAHAPAHPGGGASGRHAPRAGGGGGAERNAKRGQSAVRGLRKPVPVHTGAETCSLGPVCGR